MLLRAEQNHKLDKANFQPRKKPLLSGPSAKIIRPAVTSVKKFRAIPHNSKYRYGERGAADAKPKAQIILDAAKVSAASGGCSEPKQGQRSQSARGFCPRSTMRVPQPDIIEHFGNADAVPQPPERCLSRQAGIVRCCLRHFRRFRKRFRFRPPKNRHPSATSSTIITLKPTAKNIVPTFECCPCDISGISSSTTTYSMAPAAKLSR